MKGKRMRQVMALVAFVLVAAAAASLGAVFRPGEWYAALAKPSWTPPNGVFAPVWAILYVMIALAGWLVWRAGDRGAALGLWAIGLACNAAWSWLFFGRHDIGLALVDIAIMWATIVGFIVRAWPRSRVAALLFVPYLAWVSYATALNAAVYRLNP